MAALTVNEVSTTDATSVTVDTLTASDTFTFTGNMYLILSNDTAGALSPVLTGDSAATVEVQGLGSIDVSGGSDVFGSISAGAEKMLKLGVVSKYLTGTVTITGGTDLTARLIKLG
ncbi:MAG: hypothetical protein KTR16_02085 [Acidiferrobacterales bacterium]|nr:hypothetical protein [Acidiferrobacterales bacterium]